MSLKLSTPWLVLNGSGPAADMITELLSDLSRAPSPVDGEGRDGSNPELRDRAREIIRRYFPSEKTPEKLVDQVRGKFLSVFQILNESITFIIKARLPVHVPAHVPAHLSLCLSAGSEHLPEQISDYGVPRRTG